MNETGQEEISLFVAAEIAVKEHDELIGRLRERFGEDGNAYMLPVRLCGLIGLFRKDERADWQDMADDVNDMLAIAKFPFRLVSVS